MSAETAFYRRNAVMSSVCPANRLFTGENPIAQKIEKALSSVKGRKGKIYGSGGFGRLHQNLNVTPMPPTMLVR